MKILLTGASGFLGKYIREILHPDFDITSITRQSKNEFGWLNKDIFDLTREDLENYDCILHVAGAVPGKGFSDSDFFKLNEEATSHLVKKTEQAKVLRFVYISTTSVLSTSRSAYTLSKINAEKVVKKSKLDWVILRPSYIFGLDGGFWENMFRHLGISKKFIILKGSAHVKFHPVYVKDVAYAVQSVIKKQKFNQKEYFVAGANPITYSGFYNLFRIHSKRSFIIINLSNFMARLLGSVIKRLEQDNVSDESYDICPAIEDLAYKPHEFSKAIADIIGDLDVN